MMLSRTLYRKYQILYRVKINGKWTKWKDNYNEVNNKDNKSMTQIEIKLELK